MFMFIVFLKWISVLGLLVAGIFSLLAGLGVEVPLIRYEELEAYGVPAGAVMLAAAIALAYFWKLEYSETQSGDLRTTITAVKARRMAKQNSSPNKRTQRKTGRTITITAAHDPDKHNHNGPVDV